MAFVTVDQNLRDVSYSQGEIIELRDGAVLTVDSTPATRTGTIQCITSGRMRLLNSSTTIPLIFDLNDPTNDFRFEAGAALEIRGAPMPLGAGTGAAQSWDFTTLFGGVIRHMTYVEVERSPGSGSYMPWPVIAEDTKFLTDCGYLSTSGGALPSAFSAGNTPAGRVLFWHETNRTLQCGNGVHGSVIPNGCAVRIPNIFVSNRLCTNATRILAIESTGGTNGGTFTLEFQNEAGTVLGTTAPIAWNATAATVGAAISAVTGAGTTSSGGGPLPSAVSITWVGAITAANGGFGDIPSVRVANNSLTGTNPKVVLRENSAANVSLIDLNPLGIIDAKWCSFSDKIRLSNTAPGRTRLISCGFGCDAINFNETNSDIEIDGLSHTAGTFTTAAGGTIQNAYGIVKSDRVVRAQKSPTSLWNWVNVPQLQSPVIQPTTIHYGKRSAGSNRGMQFISVPSGLQILDPVAVGNAFQFSNSVDLRVVRPLYADGTGNVQETASATNVFNIGACVNPIIANPGSAGPMAARAVLVVPDAPTSNLQVLGSETDFANNSDRPVYLGGAGSLYQNMRISNVRMGPIIDTISNWSASGSRVRKVFCTYATNPANSAALDASSGGQYDLVSSTILGINRGFSGVSDFVGGNYTEPGLSPTTGHVTFGPIAPGQGLEVSGACYLDPVGGLFMPKAGDVAVMTMPFAMHGITGFQNAAPRIFVNAPQAPANSFVAQSFPPATGGTVTFTVANEAGVVLGTTVPIAWNALTSTTNLALQAIPGIGSGNTATGGNMSTAYTVNFVGALAGQKFIVTMDASNLTGPAGMASFVAGRALLMDGTEGFGPNLTAQFAVRVPGTAWPAYADLSGANLSGAIAALSGYEAGGEGLEMRVRLEALTTNRMTFIAQISLPTNVDPDLWSVGDASFTLQGPVATDITRVMRASDDVELYAFTGGGVKEFEVGANFGVDVYFKRENASGTVLMRTTSSTYRLSFGDNGVVPLFYGAEVQLAQSPEVLAIKALIEAKLDVVLSTRATQATAESAERKAALAAALSA
jgi:hypothetical protein